MRRARLRGPRWVIDAPSDEAGCLSALPSILPDGAVLVLEEGSMVPAIRTALQPYAIDPELRAARQTLLPRLRQTYLTFSAVLADLLASLVSEHPPAALHLCDHMTAYVGQSVVFEWHDAFFPSSVILVSTSIDETSIRAFAEGLGVPYEACAA